MKEYPYSELSALDPLRDRITLEQACGDAFVQRREPPAPEEKAAAAAALGRARTAMLSGEYDVVVIDEACVSIHFGLIATGDVVALLDARPDRVELVLTGRYCPETLVERADLVTEMREVRHYYTRGIASRRGIEW